MADTESNTYYNEGIVINGAGVDVTSTFNDWYGVTGYDSTIYTAYTQGAKGKSSLVNLSGSIPSGVMPPGVIDYVFPSKSNMQDPDYFTTDQYLLQVGIFKNHSHFIWGSYEEGGVFIINTGNAPDNAQMFIYNGMFKTGNEKYFKDLGYLGNHTPYALSQVMFFWDAWAKFNETSWSGAVYLKMFTSPDNDVQIAEYKSADLGLTWGYDMVAIDVSVDDVYTMADINWDGIVLNEKPVWIWRGGSVRDFYGPSDLDDYIRVSGSGLPADYTIDYEENPYSDGGFSGTGGGGGDLDHKSDDVDTSDSETIGIDAFNTRLVRAYNPTQAEVQAFNDFLFSGITTSIESTLKKLTSDPLQYIISLFMVHFTPTTSVSQIIQFGGISTGVGAKVISKEFKKIDCGTITVPAQHKSFLDYSSYSKASLFLPYVSFVDLDIDEIMGSAIHIVYNVDLMTGSFICEVHVSRAPRSQADDKLNGTVYTYSGNCALQVPISSIDQRGIVSSLMSIGGGAVSGLATGGGAGAIVGTVGATAQNFISEKQTVHRGSSCGSNHSYMGHQKPYLVLSRPITNVPVNFGAFEGWTSNIRAKLSTLKGYTEIDEGTLWVDGFDGITADEVALLKSITSSGFYL